MKSVIEGKKFSGDGPFTLLCSTRLEEQTGASKVLLTTSCTHALELAALLLEVEAGDEVIMPSFTFVSTANAFALRGCTIVFVDVDPKTMNIDLDAVESAVTANTKVVVTVHYGGLSCDMDRLSNFCRQNGLFLVEDAAQAIGATWHGKPLGTFGQFGTYSFHETKNVQCGEGGALLINDRRFVESAEIIREKGTDRSRFFRGQVDKYTWQSLGSSYLMAEINAAFLLSQLNEFDSIQYRRKAIWSRYHQALESQPNFETVAVPAGSGMNGHLYWIKLANLEHRELFIESLKKKSINAVFHYIPLHSSPAGTKYSRFSGVDRATTKESERLVRLPLYTSLDMNDCDYIIQTTLSSV